MLNSHFIRVCGAGITALSVLSACDLAVSQTSNSVQKPNIISFGAPVSVMEQALEQKCETLTVRAIDPPLVPDVDSQTQIDCQGFQYFGSKRLAEFVFINDALMLTWILVEASEIPELESAFTSEFGEPTFSKDTILAYADHYAGVRNDTPEALYYAPSAAPYVIDRITKLPDRK